MQSWIWLWPFLSMMHEACPASGGNSSVGTTSSSPTLKSRSSANGEASTTSLRLFHVGGLRLVVSWAHSAVSTGDEMHALSPPAAAPAAAVRRRSEALLAEVLAMGHQQGVFDLVHPEATAAAIGGMGIRVASWYPAPKACLDPSQLADAYASLALRMAGAGSAGADAGRDRPGPGTAAGRGTTT